jgi:hypothetical protein
MGSEAFRVLETYILEVLQQVCYCLALRVLQQILVEAIAGFPCANLSSCASSQRLTRPSFILPPQHDWQTPIATGDVGFVFGCIRWICAAVGCLYSVGFGLSTGSGRMGGLK